jgi:exodeoxyribonuclease VII large subunit
VARAIHAARSPVVSAVGHETDVTIADLVADVRAATPSQAGELVVPQLEELEHRLASLETRLRRALRSTVDLSWQRLESLADRPVLRDPIAALRPRRDAVAALAARLASRTPLARLRERRERLEGVGARLCPPLQRRIRLGREQLLELAPRALRGVERGLRGRRERVAALDDRLRALSPLQVLGRGYALVSGEDGRLVRSARDVAVGETLSTRVADGSRIESRVQATHPREDDAP